MSTLNFIYEKNNFLTMIIYILGILDILAGLSLFALRFEVGYFVAALFTIYLFLKSLVFIKSWPSYLDLAVVLLFVLAIVGNYNFFTYLGVLWLLQKGAFSLINA
tara:strand:+ start:425 stop:739 length:315 start_codon:yes stop_codon:yes gene_type:complete